MRRASFASRLSALSWSERALLVEAVACLGLARAAVKVVPFRRIEPRLGVRMAELPADGAPDEAVRRVARAIDMASRRTPWRSKCLEQAIAGKAMLRRRHTPSTMYLGVSQQPFEAHAWLRVGSSTVLGGRIAHRFTVIATYADRP